jgi:hypothetical protein
MKENIALVEVWFCSCWDGDNVYVYASALYRPFEKRLAIFGGSIIEEEREIEVSSNSK